MPDKLAHNAPSQSELWEARQAIPEFNGGNTLDKREATDPRGKEFQQADEPVINPGNPEAEQRGTLGQGTIKNIGLPMLQEARN